MPRTARAEPRCNLTLTRTDWSVLIAMLDRDGRPAAMSARDAIRAELRDDPDSARVGIDRECQKWIGVEQLLFKQMCKSAEGKRLFREMRTQVQAAERTQPW